MANKIKAIHLNEDGQSAVEYLLLLMVVSTIMFSVFKSQTFNNLLGEDSSFFKSVRERLEYSYRHGSVGRGYTIDYSGTNHELYWAPNENKTRFFAPQTKYP